MSANQARPRGHFGRIFFRRVTWVGAALLLIGIFGMFHLLGWRDDTAIISGTVNSTNFYGAAIRGVLYGMFYFAAVIVSPILLLAAGFDAMIRRCVPGLKSSASR